MQRQQTYLDVIVKEYTPPRNAVEYAEDGSLFGARSDTLFDMLISGFGAQTNADFESAFMYGFRAWITPVSLLQRLIEAFCTTPLGRDFCFALRFVLNNDFFAFSYRVPECCAHFHSPGALESASIAEHLD